MARYRRRAIPTLVLAAFATPARSRRRAIPAFGLMVVATIAMAATVTSRAHAQAAWTVVGEMPLERGQTIAVVEGGKIYVLTGSAPGADATGLLQAFDPATGAWEDLATMPDVASHAGAAVVDGSIYVVGGFVRNVHAGAMARVFRYDIAADTWEARAPLSVPRGSPAVVALGGRIHAVSGRNDEGLVGAHEVYDPATDTWSEAAPLPVPRDHKGIGVADGRIHVFGGRTGGSSDNTGRHDVYDPATDTWSEAPPVPTPRSGGAAFELDGRLAFAGGECRQGPAPTFAEVEAWDPGTGTWVTLPPLPEGRHAFAAASVDGTAYVIGGRTGCGGSGATLEILALEGGAPTQGARDDAPRRMLRGHILDAASGLAVEHAAVYLASAKLGTRTNATGAFVIMGVSDVGEPLELTIEHPCFHTVRIVIEDRGDVGVATGLPFRASEAGAPPGMCQAYGPRR